MGGRRYGVRRPPSLCRRSSMDLLFWFGILSLEPDPSEKIEQGERYYAQGQAKCEDGFLRHRPLLASKVPADKGHDNEDTNGNPDHDFGTFVHADFLQV